VAELADAADLKSADGDILRVQVPLAPLSAGNNLAEIFFTMPGISFQAIILIAMGYEDE
jgi:hypothetical protein